MSRSSLEEAYPKTHTEWLINIYNEVNMLNPAILSQAIINVKEREAIE